VVDDLSEFGISSQRFKNSYATIRDDDLEATGSGAKRDEPGL
jgi:hypothetical protein